MLLAFVAQLWTTRVHELENQALLLALHREIVRDGISVAFDSEEDAVAATAVRAAGDPLFEVVDLNGTRHECVADGTHTTSASASASTASAADGVAALGVDPLAGLAGRCVQMNHGYWTYQWCNKHEVLQLRVDEKGATEASHSLGVYTDIGADDSASLQRFRGGEVCEETSAPRRSDVHLKCCAGKEAGGAALTVGSLTETSKCVYTIVMCIRALCTDAAPLVVDSPPASTLLGPLKNACFQWRPPRETWWVYEYCVGKHVRQFHAEQQQQQTQAPAAAGGASSGASRSASAAATTAVAAVTVVTSEFYLGKSDGVRGFALSDEDAVNTGATDPAASYFAVQYGSGTPCDRGTLRGQARKTEVRFTCAPPGGAAHAIVSVKEDPTCSYTLVFATTLLCAHPAFVVPPTPTRRVRCGPVASA
jgi:hypothetical protein